jgi:hypothetical protein
MLKLTTRATRVCCADDYLTKSAQCLFDAVQPNESTAMISKPGHATYRPDCAAYDSDAKSWLSDDLEKLKITEQIAARISVSIPLRTR